MTIKSFFDRELTKAAVAEFLATALFVFIGCGSAVASQTFFWNTNETRGTDLHIAVSVAFGVAIAVLAYGIAPLSGGHINPAVTFSFLLQRKMNCAEAGAYWVAQLLGAMLGAATLWGSTFNTSGDPDVGNPPFNLGSNFVQDFLPLGSAFLIEAVGTFILVLTVMMTAVSSESISGNNTPIAIGWSVMLAHLVLIPFTGCGINPARSAGPHIVSAAAGVDISVRGWWVFYTAPWVGSAFATGVGMYLGVSEKTTTTADSDLLATAKEHEVDEEEEEEEYAPDEPQQSSSITKRQLSEKSVDA